MSLFAQIEAVVRDRYVATGVAPDRVMMSPQAAAALGAERGVADQSIILLMPDDRIVRARIVINPDPVDIAEVSVGYANDRHAIDYDPPYQLPSPQGLLTP